MSEIAKKQKQLMDAFLAAREFNSRDGVVDIDVVLNMPSHDLSDLRPVYANFKEYWEDIQNGELYCEQTTLPLKIENLEEEMIIERFEEFLRNKRNGKSDTLTLTC